MGREVGVARFHNDGEGEMQHLEFRWREFQWRQQDFIAEAVAGAACAGDGRAAFRKRFHIAVDAALGDAEAGGEVGGAVQPAVMQDAEELKEAVGAGHGGILGRRGEEVERN